MGQRTSLSNARTGRQLLYAVGIFALIGVALGLIGFVLLTQLAGGNNMTNAIFSGIFFLMILVTALFLGPIVAAIIGIQIGNRNESSSIYLTSLIGNTIGYIVMMLIMLAILSVGIGLISNGGSGGAMGSTSGDLGASGGGGGFGQWIFPIIAISMIAGMTGMGASYFQVQLNQVGRTETGNLSSSIPLRGILAVVLIGTVLLVGAYGTSTLLGGNPASNLEVNGEAYSQGDSLYSDVTIENVGDGETTATLTVQMVFDGDVSDDFTSSQEITVSGGESITETVEFGRYSNLSSSEMEALETGNWKVEFLINDEVKDTYSE